MDRNKRIRGLVIRLVPSLIVISLGFAASTLIEQNRPAFANQFITMLNLPPTNSQQSVANLFVFFSEFFLLLIPGLVGLFILSFQNSGKFWRRIQRASLIAIFMVVFSAFLWVISIYLLDNTNGNASGVYPFLSDTVLGLSTSILGAFFIYLLFDVFAKTWEENEEQWYEEKQPDLRMQIENLRNKWRLEAENQANRKPKNMLNRFFSDDMPNAYYEGYEKGLLQAAQELEHLANATSNQSKPTKN